MASTSNLRRSCPGVSCSLSGSDTPRREQLALVSPASRPAAISLASLRTFVEAFDRLSGHSAKAAS